MQYTILYYTVLRRNATPKTSKPTYIALFNQAFPSNHTHTDQKML